MTDQTLTASSVTLREKLDFRFRERPAVFIHRNAVPMPEM